MVFPTNLDQRNQYILDAVKAGDYLHTWRPVTSTYNGKTATFQMSADALIIEGTRVNVSASLQQQIADLLQASLPTPKLLDLRHKQADIKIEPFTRQITSSTQAMIDHSKQIDQAILKLGIDSTNKIISNVGKNWTLSNLLSNLKAMNYGWWVNVNPWKGIACEKSVTDSKLFVIQGPWTSHNPEHVDYSQTAVFLYGAVEVDGTLMTLTDVLTNQDLAPLASHEGILSILRQP